MLTPLQKIRTSFSTQLSLWVAGFVLVISGVVIFLLMRFSHDVIRDESIDTTQQVLENTALRIDNTLRLAEMAARREHRPLSISRARIEQLVGEGGYAAAIRQSLPNAQLSVTRREVKQLFYEDREKYIFSQPIADRPFCLVVTCPAQDIYGNYADEQWFLVLRVVLGVLVLLLILYYVISRHLRPLHLLADAAQNIAGGRLETPIPDAHHEHEAGRLQNSLKKMQSSLVTYMDEMQQKQAVLSRQNAELEAAYAEAQAYETLKAKVLHSMTERMAIPVEQLCSSTETVCSHYDSLSKTQMMTLQSHITQTTETITDLLDQLMAEPHTEQL